MGDFNIPLLNSLEEILLESTRMEDVLRWEKYVKADEARAENSLQHSYKASLLATRVLDNEKKHSNEAFDSYIVLKAIILHDLGEIETGDTVYIDKTGEGDKREYEFFKKLISSLPDDIKADLYLAYNIQNAEKNNISDITTKLKEEYPVEIKLFEAIERLGYLVFAYREFRREGKPKILVQTLRNQHNHLVRLANELPGFGSTFYTSETQDSVESFLKEYKGQFIENKGEK